MGFAKGEEVLFSDNGTPCVTPCKRKEGDIIAIHCSEFREHVKFGVCIEFHADNLPLFI